METPKLMIVVPCYNEQEVLPLSVPALTRVIKGLIEAGKIAGSSTVLLVNDGSRDKTWQMIEDYHRADPVIQGLKLAGNVGHQNALFAGLEYAAEHADVSVSIDADLQDDVTVIEQMIDRYAEGYDIVYGVRKERTTDTWFKRNTALAFYKLMLNMGVKAVYNHADFRLMSRRAMQQLCRYGERNLFLRGMVPLIGYRTTSVYYNRAARAAGESKYPLSKMLNFAIDGITSFSTKPVRMVFGLGLVFLGISMLILIYVLAAIILGRAVMGWASLILSIWFVGGCVLVGLGIVGEYIGKIYIEVKHRPRYNIEKTTTDEPQP